MINDINKFFRWKCFIGLKKRGLTDKADYKSRLEYELGIIEKMNFQAYFLVVQDFIYWARENNILVGPGRGSAAGSLIAFCLWITQLDPIKYDLYFERFLSVTRIAPPDIDVDFADDKRDLVIDYVRNKYGADCVAGISTFGEMKCRGAIKAAARTLGADYSIGDKLSKLTPPPVHGVPPKLTKCYEAVSELETYHNNPSSIEGKVLLLADNIEDRIDKAGAHASGWLIGDKPLHEIIPIVERKKVMCSEWDMNCAEKIGLIKFDFLGLTALTAVGKTIELIKQRHSVDIDIDSINLQDEEVLSNLRNGDVVGIFQLETSPQMKDLLIKMKPTCLEDIGLLTAIYRPGPLGSGYVSKWLKVRSGEEQPEYLHPGLEPILKETGGWLIYQESMMKIAVDLAGYTLAESDELRKACGKKLPEEMAKHEFRLKTGLKKKSQFTDKQADTMWEEIKAFASYSFNKAHSAAYGLIAYQTAWLKTHYITEYMCALLTCNQNDIDQVIKYIFDCRARGIKVLPPDINYSSIGFSIDKENNIRFGLAAIKNLGNDIVQSLIIARGKIPFKDIMDFISRVDLSKMNKRKLESLVLAGAFDFSGYTRASMIDVVEKSIDYRHEQKSYESKLQTYNKKIEAWNARNEAIKHDEIAGKKTKLKPLQLPKKPEELTKPVIKSFPELNDILRHEKELLGFYISGHPVDKYVKFIAANQDLSTVEKIKTSGENDGIVTLVAIPTSVNERTTKTSGKKMASMILEDLTGNINATAFPKTWERYSWLLTSNEPLLIKCKITQQDISETVSSTELWIQDVSSLKHVTDQSIPSNIKLTIPAEFFFVEKTRELINKYLGNETRLDISICTMSGTLIPINNKISIRAANSFLKEYAELKDGIN